MSWKDQLKGDVLPWLLDKDSPGARYLALRDLMDCPQDDPELKAARQLAHQEGPIAAILAQMQEDGYWVRPGPGYNPKYRSAVWSMLSLAQLGASINADERVRKAAGYMLDHSLAEGGRFTENGAPSGSIDCLQGNLCWALVELGCDDPRLQSAYEWMARSETGEGIAPVEDKQAALRYYVYKCGPDFACGINGGKACAWGAAKVMLAFSRWPAERRSPMVNRAIEQGIAFFFSVDPATARYPTRLDSRPSPNWWKFGFPVFYITDLLQVVEALVGLGAGHDPRLANAIEIVRSKQDDLGRWALEYDYPGKTWVDYGEKKQPNKWVTLRALRVLKSLG